MVDDHALQFFEDVGEFDDALCNVCYFALALHDGAVIGGKLFLGGLLESALGVGFVGVRFHERWVGEVAVDRGRNSIDGGGHASQASKLCLLLI